MAKLAYTDKSTFLTEDFTTVNIGTRVFDLEEEKWYVVAAAGVLEAIDEAEADTPVVDETPETSEPEVKEEDTTTEPEVTEPEEEGTEE